MADLVLGMCSQCNGAVVAPEVWMGLVRPVPQCRHCGATVKQPHGPVIETERGDKSDRVGRALVG